MQEVFSLCFSSFFSFLDFILGSSPVSGLAKTFVKCIFSQKTDKTKCIIKQCPCLLGITHYIVICRFCQVISNKKLQCCKIFFLFSQNAEKFSVFSLKITDIFIFPQKSGFMRFSARAFFPALTVISFLKRRFSTFLRGFLLKSRRKCDKIYLIL